MRTGFSLFILITAINLAHATNAQDIAASILKSPAWNYYAYEKGADKDVIDSISALADLSNIECRDVVELLMRSDDKNPARNKWFKVLVINRLIFDIPDDYKRVDATSIAGWGFPNDKFEDALLMWPVIKKDGFFRIASRSQGYSGADYDGIKEFDYFAQKFTRRKKDHTAAANW
jgi:hypothetical protein